MKKILRLNLIIVIAVLLSFNSFAWFIYSTQVSTSISTRVRAWRVDFEHGEEEVSEYVNFELDDLYPGMPDYDNVVNILNFGETEVHIQFEIIYVRILDEEYSEEHYTQQELIDMLADDFPFEITFLLTEEIIPPEMGESDFEFSVVWPFESGDDEEDTYWGSKSYDFHEENPEDSGVVIDIKISAIQAN